MNIYMAYIHIVQTMAGAWILKDCAEGHSNIYYTCMINILKTLSEKKNKKSSLSPTKKKGGLVKKNQETEKKRGEKAVSIFHDVKIYPT